MMRPALGIGWLLWRQNRTALIGLAVYLATMFGGLRLYFASAVGQEGQQITVTVFLGYSLLFLAGLGCQNLLSDAPNFKPHLFVLPIKTRSLVFWHMAYPILAAIVVWLVGARLLFVPFMGYHILWWPMALIALMISIWQAALWYPAAWYLRPVFVVLGLAGPAFLLAQAWVRDMPIETISLFLIPVVPIAVVVAVYGVELGRRGRALKRMPVLTETGLAGVAIDREMQVLEKRPKGPFLSARFAQLWLEWRTNGIILPVMVGFIYLFAFPVAVLLVGALGSGWSPWDIGIGHIHVLSALRCGVVFVPGTAFLLVSVGASVYQGTLRREGDLEPFFASRPMTTWDLFVSKIGAVTQSTAATWAITLFLTALWLLAPATDGPRHGTLGGLLLSYGPPRVLLYALAALLILVIWTWRSQVCSLCIGLSGRRWLGWGAVGLFVLQTSFMLLLRAHPVLASDVARLLPDPALVLAILKPVLAVFVFFLLRRQNLAGVATLAKMSGVWLAAVFAISAFLIWLLPPALAPARSIIAGVVLLLPLVRPSLAPLALLWNRHR